MIIEAQTEFKLVVAGHLIVDKVFRDGRRENVCDRKNQLTYLYLDRVAELLAQITTGPDPIQGQPHSLWIETSPTGVSDPTPNDTEPDAAATVLSPQKIFTDADKLVTINSDIRAVEYRTTLLETEGNGSIIQAAALFSRGTNATVPSPGTYFSGQNNVYMLARQKFGPVTKHSGFALDFNWALTLQILTT